MPSGSRRKMNTYKEESRVLRVHWILIQLLAARGTVAHGAANDLDSGPPLFSVRYEQSHSVINAPAASYPTS